MNVDPYRVVRELKEMTFELRNSTIGGINGHDWDKSFSKKILHVSSLLSANEGISIVSNVAP
jgi:hypothetical protein